jgi:hypothetical protein
MSTIRPILCLFKYLFRAEKFQTVDLFRVESSHRLISLDNATNHKIIQP